MARITLTHNFLGENSPYVILVFYRNDAPLNEASGFISGSGLGSQNATVASRAVYPAPYGQQSLLITDLDPVWYNIKAFRSSNGTTLEEQINIIAIDAASGGEYSFDLLYYMVGRNQPGDPNDGDRGLRDPRLLGKKYIVDERATGPLLPENELGAEWLDRSDAGGGFDFVNPDKTFNDGAVYVVTRLNFTPTSAAGGDIISDYKEIVELSENRTFEAGTYNRKFIFCNFASAVGRLDFPGLAGISDCKFRISTEGGQQRNVVLQLSLTDTVWFNGKQVNRIVLGKGEWLEITIRLGVMYVLDKETGHKMIGVIAGGYDLDGPVNAIPCFGQTINLSEYPRLADYLQYAQVTVVTLGLWPTQKTYFGYGGGTAIVPDLRTYFQRFIGSFPGRGEAEMVGPHGHPFHYGRGGGITSTIGGGAVIANNTNPINENGWVIANPEATENRPKNFGTIPYIFI